MGVEKNGVATENGQLNPIALKPGESTVLKIDFKTVFEQNQDYHLTVYAKNKDERHLVEADHTIAFEQFELQNSSFNWALSEEEKAIKIKENNETLSLTEKISKCL